MLVRSTGLGRTELEGDVKTLDVKADYLIIGMKTTEPVKWHVRAAIDYKDLLKIVKLSFNNAIMRFVFFGFKYLKKPPKAIEF